MDKNNELAKLNGQIEFQIFLTSDQLIGVREDNPNYNIISSKNATLLVAREAMNHLHVFYYALSVFQKTESFSLDSTCFINYGTNISRVRDLNHRRIEDAQELLKSDANLINNAIKNIDQLINQRVQKLGKDNHGNKYPQEKDGLVYDFEKTKKLCLAILNEIELISQN